MFDTHQIHLCWGISNAKKGVRYLIRNCSNIQEIWLAEYENDNNVEVLKTAAEKLKKRVGVDIPLTILFGCYSQSFRFKIRMLPIRSEKDETTKSLFQIFYGSKSFSPDFLTYDFDILVKEVTSLK